MKHILTPITLAAAAGALALGAAAGAVAASGAAAPPSTAQIRARCEQRATVRTKLRAAFRAERQKENVLRLDPAKRRGIAKPILDQAVQNGDLKPQAEQQILTFLGRPNRRP